MPRSRSSLRSMSSNDLYATRESSSSSPFFSKVEFGRVSFSMVGCGLLAVLKDRLLLLALGLSMVEVVCATVGILLGVWFWFMFIIGFWFIRIEEEKRKKIPNFSPSIQPFHIWKKLGQEPHSSKEKQRKKRQKHSTFRNATIQIKNVCQRR